ncbi:FAD-binding domain-containing protein [Coprinellus micaceus]|uniref:FAD-binding domain-containing protein n=1 Tax=Coprinellus micaceus TaxID=71717 RepID=A0A4Y7T3Z2_COPMI|nr:FAD-binding domain-containing protein [Coprinellus micaceus]
MRFGSAFLSLLVLCYTAIVVDADLISRLQGVSGRFTFTYPGLANYSAAVSPFNLRYSYQPAAVTYVNSVQQVSEVVKIGYDLGYNVVARAGGHSYAAGGLGGKNGSIVVDLYSLATMGTSGDGAIADITTGFKLGTIAGNLWDQRRALPHGTCPYVGWGGHVATGGYGFTSRLWGMAHDRVTSTQIVLANGTIATASKDVNPDLFFAVRGAASSFGIVTKTTLLTLPVPNSTTTYEYGWNLNINDATTAFQSYQSFSLSNPTPPELGIELLLAKGSSKGTVTFMLSGVWYGAAGGLDTAIKPLLDIIPQKPVWSNKKVGTYLDSLKSLAGGSLSVTAPDTHDTFYAKSLITPNDSTKQVLAPAQKEFMTYLANTGFDSKLEWFIQIGLMGGKNSAVNSIPSADTAFPHRNVLHLWQLYAYTPNSAPPFPANGFAFVDGMTDAILRNQPADWDYGAYTNYIDDRLANAEQLYFKQNLPRLKQLKAKYDPKGVFSVPGGVKA